MIQPKFANTEVPSSQLQLQFPPGNLSNSHTDRSNSRGYIHDHDGDQQSNISTSVSSNTIITVATISDHSPRLSKSTLSNSWPLPNAVDVGIISMATHNSNAPVGSLRMELKKHLLTSSTTEPPNYSSRPFQSSAKHSPGEQRHIIGESDDQHSNNSILDQLNSQTQMTTEMDNNLHTPPSDSMIVTNTTQEDYKLQQLIDTLLDDLYTDPLIEYELSIIFQ